MLNGCNGMNGGIPSEEEKSHRDLGGDRSLKCWIFEAECPHMLIDFNCIMIPRSTHGLVFVERKS